MRYLYKITNLINGKVYIGQTVNFKKRMLNHFGAFKGKNTAISLAIRKYSEINFSKEIIAECSDDTIDFMEIRAIQHFNTISPNGYNLESGGHINKTAHESTKKLFSEMRSGKTRKPHSDATKKKLSEIHKGRKKSKEHIDACRNARIGSKQSKETVEKRRLKLIGHITSEETKRKIGLANKGKAFTAEQKIKSSLAHTGKCMPLDVRAKISAAHKGKIKTAEHIKNMIESRTNNRIKNKIETKPSII